MPVLESIFLLLLSNILLLFRSPVVLQLNKQRVQIANATSKSSLPLSRSAPTLARPNWKSSHGYQSDHLMDRNHNETCSTDRSLNGLIIRFPHPASGQQVKPELRRSPASCMNAGSLRPLAPELGTSLQYLWPENVRGESCSGKVDSHE